MEHTVVTSKLPLEPHPRRCNPGKRVEPVDGAQKGGKRLRETVESLYVCKLVHENVASFPVGPALTLRRDDYDG